MHESIAGHTGITQLKREAKSRTLQTRKDYNKTVLKQSNGL